LTLKVQGNVIIKQLNVKTNIKKTRIIKCGGQWLTTYAKWVLNATKKVAQNVLTMSM
jgi:hypothetical protein